ncbi:ABC transporter permease [Oscillospiraceae bacterium OttesenSCG-928-G22]|nr:ABC transporter permease [Oscillospiraceae bacterium OttesenSCG-928-G22]
MSIAKCFQLAIKNIMSSKARSILTMLGIIIGVAAVIVIVGLGNGMETYMTDSFQSMGTNLLTVNLFGRGSSRSASVDDMYAIVDENPELFNGLSPSVRFGGGTKIGSESLDQTSVTGVSEDYLSMNKLTLRNGRFLQYADMLERHKVCVVGSYVADTYFGGNAVGETIKLNGNAYTVVGVLDKKGDGEEGGSDDAVFIPYTTAQKLTSSAVTSFSIAMTSEDDVAASKKIVEDALLAIYASSDAYSVISMSELLDTMNEMIGLMVTILAAIAAISLVVGGIGIMNIMLVSVSERTREIGIRKALGAKRRHVLWQFVIEAGTTSAIGGVLGIVIGFLLSALGTQIIVAAVGSSMAILPSTSSVLGSFGISAGIGVLFGYLPARKAAYLNPIDALRYD